MATILRTFTLDEETNENFELVTEKDKVGYSEFIRNAINERAKELKPKKRMNKRMRLEMIAAEEDVQ